MINHGHIGKTRIKNTNKYVIDVKHQKTSTFFFFVYIKPGNFGTKIIPFLRFMSTLSQNRVLLTLCNYLTCEVKKGMYIMTIRQK